MQGVQTSEHQGTDGVACQQAPKHEANDSHQSNVIREAHSQLVIDLAGVLWSNTGPTGLSHVHLEHHHNCIQRTADIL